MMMMMNATVNSWLERSGILHWEARGGCWAIPWSCGGNGARIWGGVGGVGGLRCGFVGRKLRIGHPMPWTIQASRRTGLSRSHIDDPQGALAYFFLVPPSFVTFSPSSAVFFFFSP